VKICLDNGVHFKEYTLNQLVTSITPENRHDETDWGVPEGKEK